MSDRLSSYKNRGKQEEYAKRAKAEAIQLRKVKKEEQLTKRRNLQPYDIENDPDQLFSDIESPEVITPNIRAILQGLRSQNQDEVLDATRTSRKILSKETNPPIDLFIQADAVTRFVQLLSGTTPAIQFEAAWVLTNVASGTEFQTQTAVKAGVCEAFLKLAREGAPNVVEQVLWGLSNIAGTGAEYRDLLLQMGILPVLVNLAHTVVSPTLLATAAWCLSNLCRKMGSLPDFETLLPAVPVLTRLLSHDSVAIVSDACWALSYFTDGPNERIEAVCKAGVIPFVIKLLLNSKDRTILIPALRVVGNIVTGDDVQTQRIIDAGALSALQIHLKDGADATKKEVVWALSNILAGNVKQIEAVIQANLLLPLIEVLANGDYKCRVEATWAICNFTCGGTPKHIQMLFQYGALGPLSTMLEGHDSRLIKVVLDAFGNIFRAAEDLEILPEVLRCLEEAGFTDRVELLQMHELEDIYQRASYLLSSFPCENDEDPDQDDFSMSSDGMQDTSAFAYT